MAGRWLFKTEPGSYSFAHLERDGRTTWDGVTSPAALFHLRRVRTGDRVLVYHTGNERAIVGEARVRRGAEGRAKGKEGEPPAIVLEPVRRWKAPVSLAAIKADARFRDFDLVRLGRLSVLPVPARLWAALETMGRD